MKLIINASSIFKGGAEQVALSFVDECRNHSEHEYHVIFGPNLASQVDQDSFPENFSFYLIKKRPASNPLHFIKSMNWLNRLERKIGADCVISTGGHGYWRPRAPIAGGFNMAHFIYPESPYYASISWKRRMYWKVKRKIHLSFYSRLDVIFVQTDIVKERLSKALSPGAIILKISNTVNAVFLRDYKRASKLAVKKPGELRLLTVSSYYAHKNLDIIKPVIDMLKAKGQTGFRFVLTLPQEKYETIFGDYKDWVINVGPVPIEECPSLYQECDYMFLPTLLECFSASYVEAMAMRKPILTSDMDFAHGICQDAAVYFDPVDPLDIADKLIALSDDAGLQDYMKERGEELLLSYGGADKRAERYLEILEDLSEKAKK
jgi:glycosyltransferase involved in cell wall biosynthesis